MRCDQFHSALIARDEGGDSENLSHRNFGNRGTLYFMSTTRQRQQRESEEKKKIINCSKCGRPAVYERLWRVGSDSKIILALHCTDCRCCMWCCPSFHQATYCVPSMPGSWCKLVTAGIIRHSESGPICVGCRIKGRKCQFCGVCLQCHIKRGDWSDDDSCFVGCGARKQDFDRKKTSNIASR
jgi:hypothetical protein